MEHSIVGFTDTYWGRFKRSRCRCMYEVLLLVSQYLPDRGETERSEA